MLPGGVDGSGEGVPVDEEEEEEDDDEFEDDDEVEDDDATESSARVLVPEPSSQP